MLQHDRVNIPASPFKIRNGHDIDVRIGIRVILKVHQLREGSLGTRNTQILSDHFGLANQEGFNEDKE